MAAKYEYILTDLAGTPFGEIAQADSRTLVLSHLRVPTASATIPIYSPRAADVLNNDCLLRVYRQPPSGGSKTLVFHGPVVNVEENGGSEVQTINLSAAGVLWRLSKRLLPASIITDGVTGKSGGFGSGTADLGAIARTVITDCNGVSFTGISLGSHTNSINGAYGPVFAKNAIEALAELSAAVGSFEFSVTPTEPTNVGGVDGWPQIGLFNTAPTIGTNRSSGAGAVVFNYGENGSNIESYTRRLDRDNILTAAYSMADGWPNGAAPGANVLVTRTATPQLSQRGRFEDVINTAGIIDLTLRQNVMDYHLLVRKNPRQLVTFKPALNASSRLFDHFNVGDTIRARAVVRGSVRFDGSFRVWGATISLDSNGNESMDLELVIP